VEVWPEPVALPCPECGGETRIVGDMAPGGWTGWVNCDGCDARGGLNQSPASAMLAAESWLREQLAPLAPLWAKEDGDA